MRAGGLRPFLFAALLIGVAVPRDAHTACASPTPMFHGFDSYIQCADGWPITSYAWQVSDPAINTGSLGIDCRTQGENGGACVSPISGEVGDGRVTVETDWSTPGVNGCPVDATGPRRVAISVQCSDGTGVLISLSGANFNFGYIVELAQTTDADGNVLPLATGLDNATPRVVGASVADGILTAQLHFNPVRLACDCDPNSVGYNLSPENGGTACVDNFVCTGAAGTVYTRVGDCAADPGAAISGWVSTGVTPNAAGDATIAAPQPTRTSECLFIGAPSVVGGHVGSGITGFIRIVTLAASDRVIDIHASAARGKVTVSFRTESEFEAVSFDLLAGGRVVASIPAKASGTGTGASYEASLKLGDFRGRKELVVRTNGANGSILNTSDPVSFQEE